MIVPDISSQQPTAAATTRQDLHAIIATRRELGSEYEDALVDSFLDKLDVEIAARVRSEVAAQTSAAGKNSHRGKDNGVAVVLGSLGIGIPLSGIGAGTSGLPGLALVWAGIVIANMAYALSRRSSR